MKEIENIVEQYILGNLSPDELSKFESQMAQNPDLKSEVDLQKDVIEAVKNHRRMSLKQNLSQINPSTRIGNLLTQKIAISAAILTTALVISIGIYSASVKENQVVEALEKRNKTEQTTKQKPIQDSIVAFEESNPEVEEVKNLTQVDKIETGKSNNNVTTSTVKKPSKSKVVISNPTYNPEEDFNSSNNFDEHDISNNTSHNPLPSNSEFKSLVDVDYTKCKRNDKVQSYKYSNGTYEFCGINESEPTIIEIISGNSKFKEGAKYLKYNNLYYEIVPTSSYEKFENHIITDKELRSELNKI